MKFSSIPVLQLYIFTTSDVVQKKIESFVKNSLYSAINISYFHFSELTSCLEEQPLNIHNKIVILDEGEEEKMLSCLNREYLFFFILGTALSNQQHFNHDRVILLRNLEELFVPFELVVKMVQNQYQQEYRKVAELNLKEFVKLSQSRDFSTYLLNIDEQIKIELRQFSQQLIEMTPLSAEKLRGLFPEFRVVAEENIFFSDEVFLLPIPFLFSSTRYFFLIPFSINYLQIAKLRLLYSFNNFIVPSLHCPPSALFQELKRYPYPLAVVEGDELIFYSEEFFNQQFSIVDIRQIEDGAILEKENKHYIMQQSLLGVRELIIFVPQNHHELHGAISSQELGIITSSIAHELNNPLAGILSATSVLKLEDFWDSEEFAALDEIELTAKRCKKIIEIFLGFSKGTTFHDRDFKTREVIEQALELIRYRSAELDIHLLLNFIEGSEELRCSKISILTMVFYIVFSELLTLINHEILVVQEGGIHNIDVDITLTADSIALSFDSLSEKVLQKLLKFSQDSRLLRHLLSQLENSIQIDIDTLTIRFIEARDEEIR